MSSPDRESTDPSIDRALAGFALGGAQVLGQEGDRLVSEADVATTGVDPFRLEGTVALITGGSRGIGLGIATEFARAGCDRIVLSARGSEELEAARMAVERLGTKCVGIVADITRDEQVDDLIRGAVDQFGDIGILINNAGVASFRASVKDTRSSGWRRMIDVNLTGTFLVTRAVLQQRDGDPGGLRAIVNIGSTSALSGFAGIAHYAASKHGLMGLTRSLAKEVAPEGIRVNMVCPHLIATSLGDAYRDGLGQGALVDDIPMGRWGRVDEVARVVRFVASDAASYMTGSVLTLDGGWSA